MIRKIAWVGLALVLLVMGTLAAPAPKADDGVKLDPATQAKVRKLQIQHRDVLKVAVEARQQEYEAGRGTLERLLAGSRFLLKAELDLATTREKRIAAHAAMLKVATQLEKTIKKRFNPRRVTEEDYEEARAFRLEAEIGWLKAGGGKETTEKKK